MWNPRYGDSLHAYMGSSGIGQALVVVYNKDTSEMYAEKIQFDSDRYAGLREKVGTVLMSKELPDRPGRAKSKSCQFCKWCDTAEWCWSPLREANFDE